MAENVITLKLEKEGYKVSVELSMETIKKYPEVLRHTVENMEEQLFREIEAPIRSEMQTFIRDWMNWINADPLPGEIEHLSEELTKIYRKHRG